MNLSLAACLHTSVEMAASAPTVTGVTFSVNSEAKRCTKTLPKGTMKEHIKSRLGYNVEACYNQSDPVVHSPTPRFWGSSGEMNALVDAVHTAFDCHYPLVLSPDMIWLCIMQGLSIHVNENAEKLRSKFVSHQGKEKITVRRDDFVKGQQNPWQEVFSEFSAQIRGHIGVETHDLILPQFSTTDPVSKAVSEIVLMDAMKSYFGYTFDTCCGFPEITLEGSPEDWRMLRKKAEQLAQFDLDWWIPSLLPILDQFVAASCGDVDQRFWSDIYKLNNASGGPYCGGWILKLFPYLTRGRNPWIKKEPRGHFSGAKTNSFPSGLSRVPFVWEYVNTEYKMHFVGGFVAVKQDPKSFALRPELGWAVVEACNATPGA